MRTKIKEIINTVLKNRGDSPIELLEDGLNLRADIGLDSLDLAELTVRLEAEFDVDIFEDGVIKTVGEIFEKLNKK